MTGEIPPYSTSIFWSDEDDCFVAVCPELPGLSGLGASREEAAAELSTVLELVMETFAEDGEPLPPAAVKPAASGQFRLRIPRSLHAQLTNRAELEGVSLNTLAVTFLAQGVAGEGSKAVGSKRGKVA
jgi:antitoxin HicB